MEHLIISVLGENQVGVADKLTEIAANSCCNIVDCKMMVLGQEFTAILHLSGTWNAIAKAESLLDILEKQMKFHSLRQRTTISNYPKDVLPYIVYVIAKDQMGLMHKVSRFFAEEGIAITELYSEMRPARKFGAQIMSLTMYVNVPADENIADFRERFILFCDHYNIDGIMEAEKGL
jgi:glycine cleavage system transcriptional repressor